MQLPLDDTLWKAVIDTMEEGLMLVDPNGRIRFVNRAFEGLLGYSDAELRGKGCEIFQCDRCFTARADGLDKYCVLFKKGEAHRSECTFRHRDGRRLHLLKNAAVIRDRHGRIVGGVETLTDLSRVVAGEKLIASLQQQLRGRRQEASIVGESPAMRQVLDLAASAAQSDAPVVLYGESGTGKELLAGFLHRRSPRAAAPFIKVNCAALNDNLLESELFGHVKGAFTGAAYKRIGRFEAADGGTIFLDEIGDLGPATQTKLLRVLQEQEIERVGDHRPIKINVRVICATNKDLERLIGQGKFREDLYYRINVVPITLPPLRQRADDIPLLVEKAIQRARDKTGKPITGIDNEALESLIRYSWPGNIRELLNVIEYAFVVCHEGRITVAHLPLHIRQPSPAPFGRDAGSPFSSRATERRRQILAALEQTGGHRGQAAALLGVSRVTLWKWMKKYGVKGE